MGNNNNILLKRIYLFVCTSMIFLLMPSCNENKAKYNYELVTTDSLDFKVGYEISHIPRQIQYVETETDTLIYLLNDFNNGIFAYKYGVYDQAPMKYKFPEEGPEGIGKLSGFYVEGVDTIFTLSSSYYRLSLFKKDSSGTEPTLISRYSLLPKSDTITSSMPVGETSMSMQMINHNSISIIAWPDLNYDLEYIRKGDNLLIVDIDDSTVVRRNIYSDVYKNQIYAGLTMHYHRAINEEKKWHIYSPGADDSLTITDYEGKKIMNVYAGSKYVGKVKGIDKSYADVYDLQQFNDKSSSYFAIIYDKYKGLYYRFALVSPEVAEKYGYEFKAKSLSIIVLDETFKKIYESELLDSYHPYIFFVNSKGLHIWKPKIDFDQQGEKTRREDIISFAVINLKLKS